MNLYDIQQQFRDLVRRIEEADGEITPDLEEGLAINDIDFTEKASGYAAIISESEEEAKAIRFHETRLAALRHAKERLASKLRERLAIAVRERGGSAKLPLFTLSAYDTTSVMVNVEASELPEKYRNIKLEVVPHKATIRADLAAGVEIPGCSLCVTPTVRIK